MDSKPLTISEIEKELIPQIRSFLACWFDGKEKDYQELAEELYWKAIHEGISQKIEQLMRENHKSKLRLIKLFVAMLNGIDKTLRGKPKLQWSSEEVADIIKDSVQTLKKAFKGGKK